MILVEIFIPEILALTPFSSMNDRDFLLLVDIARILFPYLIFMLISSVFCGILIANNKFIIPASLNAIINFSVIILAYLSSNNDLEEILYSISWAVILGGFVQVFILFFSVGSNVWKSFFRKINTKINIKKFYKLIWPTFLSSTFVQINVFLFLFLAAFETGAISYLFYAERLFVLPVSLVAISINNVLIPNFSNLIKNQDLKVVIMSQYKAINIGIYISIPLSACMFYLSDEIVRMLFNRGNFDLESVNNVALLLRFFLVGLPFVILIKIISPIFYSIEDPMVLLKISARVFLTNILCTLVLFNYFGLVGIPIALSFSFAINFLLILNEQRKREYFLFNRTQIIYLSKSILLSIFLVATLMIHDTLFLGDTIVNFISKTFLIVVLWLFWMIKFDNNILLD